MPGHSGVPMNERADERAREAIERRKTKAVDVG
jgi:ribonuclease HI